MEGFITYKYKLLQRRYLPKFNCSWAIKIAALITPPAAAELSLLPATPAWGGAGLAARLDGQGGEQTTWLG